MLIDRAGDRSSRTSGCPRLRGGRRRPSHGDLSEDVKGSRTEYGETRANEYNPLPRPDFVPFALRSSSSGFDPYTASQDVGLPGLLTGMAITRPAGSCRGTRRLISADALTSYPRASQKSGPEKKTNRQIEHRTRRYRPACGRR